MSGLTKARSVLDFSRGGTTHVTFASKDEDTGEVQRSVIIRLQDYEDMGRPEQVTITIEPGDRLNEPEPKTPSNRTIVEHVELVGHEAGRQGGLYINGEPAGFAIERDVAVRYEHDRPLVVSVGIFADKVTLPERKR